VQADDILDAMAACWTAERVRRGVGLRLPEGVVVDSRGLRMEIVR
jgi:predicted RNase H-like nuclease